MSPPEVDGRGGLAQELSMPKPISDFLLGVVMFLIIALLIASVVTLLHSSVRAQNTDVCWDVPNGLNRTMLCQSGYWQTVTPEGNVYTGNGTTDPNASAVGSGIIINPGTGGPFIGAGQTVTGPTQILPMLEPHQATTYGFMPRQD
jgi:hypothetical protein